MAIANINVGDLAGGVFDLIDDLFTTDEERDQARLKLLELARKGELAQLEVNKTEAVHGSVFVAGWRPAIGWICGAGLAIAYIVLPLVSALQAVAAGEPIPPYSTDELMPVLLGMLGLGGLRTFEKTQGVARKELAPRWRNPDEAR